MQGSGDLRSKACPRGCHLEFHVCIDLKPTSTPDPHTHDTISSHMHLSEKPNLLTVWKLGRTNVSQGQPQSNSLYSQTQLQ